MPILVFYTPVHNGESGFVCLTLAVEYTSSEGGGREWSSGGG